MKKISKRAKAAYLLLIVFTVGLVFFYTNFAINGGKWALSAYNTHIYSNGALQTTGSIVDRYGKVLAKSENGKRTYYEDLATRKSLMHIIGDNSSFLSGSIQQTYADKLAGYSALNGVHMLSAFNKVSKMELSISAELQKKVANAFGSKRGAVIAYNYKTGEIVCSLSAPNYDPQNKPENLDGSYYEGIYVNRALNGMYPPGSTFKIITSIAAIENIPDIFSQKFVCNGKCTMPDGGTITCSGKHGEIDFKKGFSVSCNVVFANVANMVGAEKIKSVAEKFGFNQNGKMGKIGYSGGYYDAGKAGATDLGWSGIGQYTVLASPITMMQVSGAVANGGSLNSTKVVNRIYNAFGIPTNLNISLPKSVISNGTSSTLNEMMKMAAEYTFGESTVNNYSLRCKTGTAEVEKGKPHAWLSGFMDSSENPYAFAIIVENGGSAASSTRYVALTLLKGLTELER